MKTNNLIQALEPRLYHACQLRDLELYASRGRIVRRSEMFASSDPTRYTPFESDDFDIENGHADSTFGNLSDGGNAYNNKKGMPSAYGPITFEFPAGALRNCGSDDVFVRRRGVYTRDREGATPLKTAAEIHDLYVQSKGFGQGEFEIPGGTLQLRDAVRVTVAPITVNGHRLIDEVRKALAGVVDCEIVERTGPAYSTQHYEQLVAWAADAAQHEGKRESLPADIKPWYDGIAGEPRIKDNNLRRFAHYIEHGTLSRLRGEEGHLGQQYVDSEEFEPTSLFDISQYAELSADELATRDDLVERIKAARSLAVSSAQRFNRALERNEREEELSDKRDSAQHDYESLRDAVQEANDWIQWVRNGIESGIDEVSHLTPDAHDSYAVDEMQAWINSLDDIEELPDIAFDGTVEIPDVDLSPLTDMQVEIESRAIPDGPYD